MGRLTIAILNLVLFILGFIIVYSSPLNALAITFGMFLIAISIISFAVLIYFPPSQPGYVKLRVVEEIPKVPKRISSKRPVKRRKRRKR